MAKTQFLSIFTIAVRLWSDFSDLPLQYDCKLFRSPGTPCGCGSGDSGCSECGCCRTCAGEGINDLEGVGGVEVAAGGEGAGGAVPVVNLIR